MNTRRAPFLLLLLLISGAAPVRADDWIVDLQRKGAFVAHEPEKDAAAMVPRVTYLERKLESDVKPLVDVLRATITLDTRLVTLGESHFIDVEYDRILAALDDVMPIDAIFLEVDYRRQREIDEAIAHGASDMIGSFQGALAYAVEHKTPVYAADDERLDLTARNVVMAAKIRAVLGDEGATRGVLIGGSAHHVSSVVTPTIPALLPFTTKSYRTYGPDFALVWEGGAYWHRRVDPVDGLDAFATDDPVADHVLRLDGRTVEGTSHWDDYDAIIVVPYR